MERKIIHTFEITVKADVVWEYLTKSDHLSKWLMDNDFELTVGHNFTFKTKPKIKMGFDGSVYCEVLEIESAKKLSYTWVGGMSKEKALLNTILTWTLEPNDKGCILFMEHSGFKGVKNYLAYFVMNMGWVKIGKRLIALIDKNER